MATGDLKNNLRRLQSKLKLVNYPKDMDMKGISHGSAQEFLPILHFILLDFSRPMAEHVVNNDIELSGKSDEKFMAGVYKIFRDIFHYKPSITRQQFFSRGFAEHKILFVIDLIRMVKEKHKEFSKAPGYKPKPAVLPKPQAPEREAQTTPDLLTASPNEMNSRPPTTGSDQLEPETDVGYHTAETSPTIKTLEEEAPQASVSVHELRAKFEGSTLQKQESQESKMSDSELEENPVIRALIKEIVRLEEQLTESDQRGNAMQARMVLLENRVIILENKLSSTQREGKPIKLTQGPAQEVPMAFLRPTQRQPENVPLPDSPHSIPRTPNQTPSSARTPPVPIASEEGQVQELFARLEDIIHKGEQNAAFGDRPRSVKVTVGAVEGHASAAAADTEVMTVLGAGTQSPLGMPQIRPFSSTPIETIADDINVEEGPLDINEEENIEEEIRSYAREVQEQDIEQASEADLEEYEQIELPVREVRGLDRASRDHQDTIDSVCSQMQRVRDMLTNTQEMLSMDTSLTTTAQREARQMPVDN